MNNVTSPESLVKLCRSCAYAFHGGKYANEAAKLLAGTAVCETHLLNRRQYGYTWEEDGGAFGLWQIQKNAMVDVIDVLRTRPDVAMKSAKWLFENKTVERSFFMSRMKPAFAVHLAGVWDRFGCLTARLHYLKWPEPIPTGVEELARYYKRYWNTYQGAAAEQDFIDAYVNIVAPEWDKQETKRSKR